MEKKKGLNISLHPFFFWVCGSPDLPQLDKYFSPEVHLTKKGAVTISELGRPLSSFTPVSFHLA
jgi:hypothetical protein